MQLIVKLATAAALLVSALVASAPSYAVFGCTDFPVPPTCDGLIDQ